MIRLGVGIWIVLLTFACSTADAATISAAVGDDARVYFATDEALLPADTDGSVDIYERAGGTLTLASAGDPSCAPACGNGAFDVQTAGGIHLVPNGLVFSTPESLLPADTDDAVDIYERSEEGGLSLLSQGPNGFNGSFDADLQSVSKDGASVVFTTVQQLVGADTDSSLDVYERNGGTTTLVSQGPDGFNGSFDAEWAAGTPDGSSVFFLTAERLVDEDTDSSVDLYKRQGGVTTLISKAAKPFNGEFDVGGVVKTSEDGERTAFVTAEPLAGEQDEDHQPDVYMRSGGTTRLLSQGSYTPPNEWEYPVELDALAPNANQAVFESSQILNYEDHDGTGQDVYQWYYGKTILSSQGPSQPYFAPPQPAEFLAFAPVRLGVVFFSTDERLLPEDTDNWSDIYERELESPDQTHIYRTAGGTTKLVSLSLKGASGPYAAYFHAVSADGLRVLFTTAEQLVDEDTDSSMDLYERYGGYATRLVSAGQINGNGPFDVTARGNGETSLFTTKEGLVPGDTDSEPDLFQRLEGRTRLVSTGKPVPPAPTFDQSEPSSPANANDPALRGSAEQEAMVELFSDPNCTGSPLVSGSAAEFASPGLSVHVPDDSASSLYARATDMNENTGPCSGAFVYVEDSTPPAMPTIASIDPAGPANYNTPRIRGAAEGDATVRIFSGGSCEGAPVAEATAAVLSGPGIAVTVPDDSRTTFSADAVDTAGNHSGCGGTLTYDEDSTPPETRIDIGPAARTKQRRATFAFAASEPGAAFVCRLDGRPERPCGYYFQLPRVGLGRHRLSVAAVDPVGNVDATPAAWAWRVLRKHPRRRHRRHTHHHRKQRHHRHRQ